MLLQPVVELVKVNVAVPILIPVTTPALVTVAIDVLLLVQVPPVAGVTLQVSPALTEIQPPRVGIELTVTEYVRAVLLPQLLFAVTLIVPLCAFVPGVKEMLLVVELPLQPLG